MEYLVPKKQGKKELFEYHLSYSKMNQFPVWYLNHEMKLIAILDKYEEDAFKMVLNVVLEMIIAAMRGRLAMLFPMDLKMENIYMD